MGRAFGPALKIERDQPRPPGRFLRLPVVGEVFVSPDAYLTMFELLGGRGSKFKCVVTGTGYRARPLLPLSCGDRGAHTYGTRQ